RRWKVIPSGARSIAIPLSEIVARPATSRSSMVSAGRASGTVPETRSNESGSKPRRSVKRQCSWVVSGSGSSCYAVSASAFTRRVPAVQHELVAVGVLEEGEVADPGVDDGAVELHAFRLELRSRGGDVGNADRDPGGARRELLSRACRIEDVERDLT